MKSKIKAEYSKDEPTLPMKMYGYYGEMGRSTSYVDCPVCGHRHILVYLWSLHGSGKKCPNCGSMFTGFGCQRNILWKGGAK